MNYNWLNHWEQADTPFHQNKINCLLEKHWPLNSQSSANVLVPLCGKSLDLLWISQRSQQVIGIELSQIACEAFFVENNLDFTIQANEHFICYHNDRIKIYCGDFFAVTSDMLPAINAVYDRAALIALPAESRQRYANHLTQLMAPAAQMLLIVFDTANEVQGPPYPVSNYEIKQLYAKQFRITELENTQINPSPHLLAKGYQNLSEIVYNLEKN